MSSFLNQFVSLPFDTSLNLLLDVVIKATLLVLLAGGVNALLRRKSAAVRHRVWCLAFCGLLLLPALTTFLPSWRLPILPQPADDAAAAEADLATLEAAQVVSLPEADSLAEADFLSGQTEPQADELFGSRDPLRPWETLQQPQTAAKLLPSQFTQAPADDPTEQPAVLESKNVTVDSAASVPWGPIIGVLWLVGACLAVWPLVTGFVRNGLLHRAARTFDDRAGREWIQTLSTSLGLRRRVRLLETGRAIVPMTWGILRPIVLFPVAWREWTPQRRRLVLLHELAHVKRCDVGFQLIARLSCALYWFHPLAWYALKRLRVERELACDDCVLMTGARPSEYAQELLEIARSYQSLALPTTVAMAHTSNLEQRIRSLLDRARSHLPLSRTAGALLLIGSMLLVTGVAVVKPSTREATVESDGDTATTETASEPIADNTDPSTTLLGQNDPISHKPAPSADKTAAKPPAESVAVTGTVLFPGGSPAPGATVRAGLGMSAMLGALVGADYELPVSETVTDELGNFSISISKQPCGDLSHLDLQWQDDWKRTIIAASLPGYGGQWVEFEDIEGDEPISLQLVEDVPVTGRVIDLEGRPVVGLKVEMEDLRGGKDDDLTAWIDAAKGGEIPWTLSKQAPLEVPLRLIGVPQTVTTNVEGRFTVKGLGRDRLLEIELTHDTVAYQAADIVTREIESFERQMTTPAGKSPRTVYGPTLTLTSAPSRPIVGVVRDADTGEPLPGVEVASFKLDGDPFSQNRLIKTKTDAKGRYRLTGMPKGDGNGIVARPTNDQPYFIRQVDVPNPTGIDPVTVNIDLHRGLWITGRVTDKVTGEPVHAWMFYLPYRSNEHTIPLPEFTDNGETHAEQRRFKTAADGTYRLVGLPGPAVIGADSRHKTYRQGAGYDKLTGPKYSDTDSLNTYSSPMMPNPKWPNAMHEVDIGDDAESFVVDLQMDPGSSIAIATLDAAGQPLTGVTVTGFGANSYSPPRTFDTHRFVATGFGPDETRTVRFEKDNLGWIERISPQSASADGVTVTLQPMATITARLLHQDGSPLAGINIIPDPAPEFGISYAMRQHGVTTNQEGRFRLALPAGVDYSLSAEGFGIDMGALIANKLTIEPGETKDPGDLRLVGRKFKRVAAAEETSVSREATPGGDRGAAKPQAAASDGVVLRGTVTGPDGKPMRGAQVWVGGPGRLASEWSPNQPGIEWTPVAKSDAGGRFETRVDRATLEAGQAGHPDAEIRLAATADGYGFAWADVKVAALEENINLKLVNDISIEGRLVTIDGTPAAGVSVTVNRIIDEQPEWMEEYLKHVRANSSLDLAPPSIPFDGEGPASRDVMTDDDGRFRIDGLGAGRVVKLEAIGGSIGSTRLAIVTHPVPQEGERIGTIAAMRVGQGYAESIYYTTFTHAATPGRTLRGVVTDAETGEPVAGVQVMTFASWHSRIKPSITDREGRYEILNVPKLDEYQMTLEPTESRHFNKELNVKDTQGFEPQQVDVTLVEGIAVRGRVTDAETGEPVSGMVIYSPLFPNENVLKLGDELQISNPAASSTVGEDGTYEISALPGPGVIAVRIEGGRYLSAQLDADRLKEMLGKQGEQYVQLDEHGDVRYLFTAAGEQAQSVVGLDAYHAAALLSLSSDTEKLTLDLTLVPGRTRTGTVVDDEGQPLTGVIMLRLNPTVEDDQRPSMSAEFTVEGLAEGRKRTLWFLHPERQLGAGVEVSGDDLTPLTVQLPPTGTITGRFVNQLGEPRSGVRVRLTTTPSAATGDFWVARCDDDGRFRLTGAIAGIPYYVGAVIPEQSKPLFVQNNITVASGGTVDIGEFMQADQYLFQPFTADAAGKAKTP